MNYINSSFGSPLDSSSESFNSFLQKSPGPRDLEDEGPKVEGTPSSVVFQNNELTEAVGGSPLQLMDTYSDIERRGSEAFQNNGEITYSKLNVLGGEAPSVAPSVALEAPHLQKNEVEKASLAPRTLQSTSFLKEVPTLVLRSSNPHYSLLTIAGKQFSFPKQKNHSVFWDTPPLPKFPLTDSKNTRDFKSAPTLFYRTAGPLEQKQVFGRAQQKTEVPRLVISESLGGFAPPNKSDIQKALTTKSKNILTLLFSIFIATGGAGEGEKAAATLGEWSVFSSEFEQKKLKTLFNERSYSGGASRPPVGTPLSTVSSEPGSNSPLRGAPRGGTPAKNRLAFGARTSGLKVTRPAFVKTFFGQTTLYNQIIDVGRFLKNSMSLKLSKRGNEGGGESFARSPQKFIRKKNNEGGTSASKATAPSFLSYTKLFPFFILLYSLIVGFRGSTQKVISHEKRISSNRVQNQVYKTNPRNKVLSNSSLELPSSKLHELRFSEYSPLGVSLPTNHGFFQPLTETRAYTSDSEITSSNLFEKLLWKMGASSGGYPSLQPPQNSFSTLEKYFLEGVYISTQIFVFLTLQNLISENNFGRNNPLKQKDSKSNQARILWPKNNRLKSLLFWKNTSRKQDKGIPDLPGIQEVTSLIEVLIESLQKKTQLKGFAPPSLQSAPRPKVYPPQKSQTSWQNPPKGYLFVGPPGTGKTLLAQEIAQLAQVPFICVSASEIQKQIEIGTRIGALRLRKLFQQAQSLSPCILFFDEIDAIAQRQSQHDSKLFTEFLIQMDGFQGAAGRFHHPPPPSKEKRGGFPLKLQMNSGGTPHSVILGTTNYLKRLDSAFVRSGRFDRILALTYPSKKIRFDILVFYIKKTEFKGVTDQLRVTPQLFTSLGLNYFSFCTDGFSQAHLARLVNESLLFTISQKIATQRFESLEAKHVLVSSSNSLRTSSKDFLKTRHKEETFGRSSLHSFPSLLHGLKQMKRHRKNLPQDNTSVS